MKMKAAVVTKYGGLDKVNFAEVDKPKPGAGEVLVQVSQVGGVESSRYMGK
jgi:NADPH:quinone reductase-like Zn-dependent oxidoreductase